MLDEVKATAILEIAKLLYKSILRPVVENSIEDSETKVDDFILKLCDLLFGYKA